MQATFAERKAEMCPNAPKRCGGVLRTRYVVDKARGIITMHQECPDCGYRQTADLPLSPGVLGK